MPPLDPDDRRAVLQIKKALFDEGYRYGQSCFRGDDILAHKVGNCLGLPFLIGALFAELRRPPRFKVLTSILDGGFEDENDVILPRVLDELRYDRPELVREWDEHSFYRFHPLQHLVIDIDGGRGIEATLGGDDVAPAAEAEESISYEQGLACILKDRAVQAYESKDLDQCRQLIEESRLLWPTNRELYALAAEFACYELDDDAFDAAVAAYTEIGGDDSLFHLSRYCLTYEADHLRQALAKYPACANAVTEKAKTELNGPDRRDACYTFAVASHLRSMICIPDMDITDFYCDNFMALATAYDSDTILDILEGYADFKWGDFDYHLAVYTLSGDRSHAAEAIEAAEVPLDWVQLYLCAEYRHDEIPPKLRREAGPYLSRKLIGKIKRDLFIHER